jgi:hypothetical protein
MPDKEWKSIRAFETGLTVNIVRVALAVRAPLYHLK